MESNLLMVSHTVKTDGEIINHFSGMEPPRVNYSAPYSQGFIKWCKYISKQIEINRKKPA